MAKRPDYRSAEAKAYRWLYSTRRWQEIRSAQLDAEPLCRMCAQEGIVMPANVVDHVDAHKGDEQKFFNGEVQSLCKPCHDRHAQRRDRGADITPTGLDGWPVALH
jgi:5-methylcytosine-specific restriction enzyme A